MTLSAEQRSQVEEWYRAGIGTTYIASRVGVSRQAIAALLRRRGIDLRSQLKLTDSDKDAAVRWYVAGESTAKIGEKLNVSSVTVLKVLRQRGAEVRGGREGQRDDAFDEFTPEAAYWLGFLFADGCVFTRAGHQPVISVAIAARDHSQLVKLKAFLGSSNSISLVKGKHPSCRLWVTSAALASRLIAAGRYSGSIDPKLVGSRHFWRGVVDGDGSIGQYAGRPGGPLRAQFRLCGEQRILVAFLDFLRNASGFDSNISVRPHHSIYQVGTTGPAAARIITHLYANAPVVLDRKAEVAARVTSPTGPQAPRQREGPTRPVPDT